MGSNPIRPIGFSLPPQTLIVEEYAEMEIAVLFLGELVGRLQYTTNDGWYGANKGTVTHEFPAENCTLLPMENIDWLAVYRPPEPKQMIPEPVIMTLEREYCI